MPELHNLLIALFLLFVLLGLYLRYRENQVKDFFEPPESPLSPEVQANEQRLMKATLYVHLANDGGILILPGNTLTTEWVSMERLEGELNRVKRDGGMVLYSRDNPEAEPPQVVEERFEKIVSYKLPIKLMREPHPDAMRGGSQSA